MDLDQADLPPVLKKFSWTLAAPYKEEVHHRGISDTIGNNYSPAARALSAKELSALPLPPMKRASIAPIPGIMDAGSASKRTKNSLLSWYVLVGWVDIE